MILHNNITQGNALQRSSRQSGIPRELLAGVKSEGMILCAEDADGNLSLMVPEKKMPAGAEIC